MIKDIIVFLLIKLLSPINRWIYSHLLKKYVAEMVKVEKAIPQEVAETVCVEYTIENNRYSAWNKDTKEFLGWRDSLEEFCEMCVKKYPNNQLFFIEIEPEREKNA